MRIIRIQFQKTLISIITDKSHESLTEITNLLEKNNIFFKVLLESGDAVSQEVMGYGGYEYWLSSDKLFSWD